MGRVMIVSDELRIREIVRAGLAVHHDVVEANGDGRPLAIAVRRRPDIAILDVGPPGDRDFATCRAIREHPVLDSVRIVAIAEHATAEEVRAGLEAGADAVVAEPAEAAWKL